MNAPAPFARFRVLAIGLPVLVAVLFTACSQLTGPVDRQQNITLSREINFTSIDSLQLTSLDTVDAPQLSSAFNAVKDRITLVSCSEPSVTATAFTGSDSTMIDSLFLWIGDHAAAPQETLAKSFLRPDEIADAAPHVVNVAYEFSPSLIHADHFLGLSPYAFSLRVYVHATHPISRLVLRVDFPLTVSYLN